MKNIFLLIVFFVLVIVGVVLAEEHSHVQLTYGDWAITIESWLLLLALIAFIFIYKMINGGVCWFINLPNRWNNYRKNQNEGRTIENQQVYQSSLANINAAHDLAELNEQWNKIPQRLRQKPEFAAAYVRKAVQYNGEIAAASVIEWQLSREWQPQLVNYYGLLKQNAAARLVEVEHWLKQHANDAILLLAAARLSIATEQWGKAERYLQQSIQQKPSVEAYLELAQVEQQLGKPELSLRNYQMARNLQREVI